MTTATVTPFPTGRMSAEQYEAERSKIVATYGESKQQAGIRWEQELAKLFYRSGWTQEELAAQEGKSRIWVTCQIRFGAFLNFVTACNNFEILPKNLTEGCFRRCWEQTDKGAKEHTRFAKVVEMMKANLEVRADPLPRVDKAAVERFCDGQWHQLPDIAESIGRDEERAAKVMSNLNRGAVKVERKRVGKSFAYRVFKSEKTVSATELAQKLSPIIDQLKAEGRKNMTTMSPGAVAHLAALLQRQLDDWTA